MLMKSFLLQETMIRSAIIVWPRFVEKSWHQPPHLSLLLSMPNLLTFCIMMNTVIWRFLTSHCTPFVQQGGGLSALCAQCSALTASPFRDMWSCIWTTEQLDTLQVSFYWCLFDSLFCLIYLYDLSAVSAAAGSPDSDLELAQQLQKEEEQRRKQEEAWLEREQFKMLQVRALV